MKKIFLVSAITASLLLASSIDFKEADKDPRRVAPSSNSVVLTYHNSIKDAKNSVVNISTTKVVKQSQELEQMFNHPLFKEFFGRSFKMPERKRKASSLGSGVIISENGYIITNNHVVADADEILVTMPQNDKEYKAKVVGLDPQTDLAVIKIDEDDLKAISFANSSNAQEGDMVFAIGNPFGVGISVTQGIISALNKSGIGLNQYENFIQTDASINPGNSGGALVDSRGALVGINTAILSRSGGNNGIGFAIPSNMVKKIAKTLVEDGKIDRGYMGVSIGNLTKDMKEVYTNKHGALILGIQEGEPAQKAGLRRGDLIIKIDDKKIEDANELKNIIGSKLPGQKIEVTYERDNKIKTTTMKLDRMSTKDSSGIASSTNDFLKGLKLATLNDEMRYNYQIPRDVNGVMILEVEEDSKADKTGFKKGDIIVQVEQTLVKNIDELNSAFKKTSRKKIRVWINRGNYITPVLVK